MKKTDNQIIRTLNKHNALTEPELIKKLGYASSLRNRLHTMNRKGKIRYVIVANNTACKYKMFPEYAGVKLYYTDEEHLKKWVHHHTPVFTSSQQQQAFTMRLRREFKIDKPSFTTYEAIV